MYGDVSYGAFFIGDRFADAGTQTAIAAQNCTNNTTDTLLADPVASMECCLVASLSGLLAEISASRDTIDDILRDCPHLDAPELGDQTTNEIGQVQDVHERDAAGEFAALAAAAKDCIGQLRDAIREHEEAEAIGAGQDSQINMPPMPGFSAQCLGANAALFPVLLGDRSNHVSHCQHVRRE